MPNQEFALAAAGGSNPVRQAKDVRDERDRYRDAFIHLRNAVGLACGARISEKDCALYDAMRHAETIASEDK